MYNVRHVSIVEHALAHIASATLLFFFPCTVTAAHPQASSVMALIGVHMRMQWVTARIPGYFVPPLEIIVATMIYLLMINWSH